MSGQKSDNALIESEVPQGSVLGPLLFLIYINDLNQAMKFSRVHHFADDTNLLLVDNSLKKIKKNINHDLKLLTAWLRANRISLNTSKTEIFLFRPKSKRNITKHLNFRISGKYISRKTQVKYVGLTIFFFYQGFLLRTLTTHKTAGKGRGPSYSTLQLSPAHEHSDIYLQLCT